MLTLLARWLVNAAALLLVAYLYPGVQVDSFVAALLAALVLGLVNAIVRPLLVVLTLPVTLLTLGLFLFVINALLFWLVAELVQGFAVGGFWAALLGSVLYSIVTLLTSWILFPRRK
jgi:putative membrane protein